MMWVFNAVLPEGSKVTDIQFWFSALPLSAENSLKPLMILWTVDGEISNLSAVLCSEMLFLTSSLDYLPRPCS